MDKIHCTIITCFFTKLTAIRDTKTRSEYY